MKPRVKSVLRVPSRQVLGPLPERVAVFLRGIALNPDARAALVACGYTAADHREGQRLLNAVLDFSEVGPSFLDDEPARVAEAEVIDWVATNFGRLRTAVERVEGRECAVFAGIEAADERDAVVALEKLLERVKELPVQDCSIRQTLVRRGLDDATCERLAARVECAKGLGQNKHQVQTHDARQAELIALYRWHTDWAGTAKSLIRHKRILSVLGISRRPRREPAEQPADEAGE